MSEAILLVDIQNDYFPGGKFEVPGAKASAEKTAQLLKYGRENRMLIAHIRHFSTKPRASYLIPESEGSFINDTVKPANGEKVFIKNYPNSFRLTGLDEYLKGKGIKKLIICGMMTQMCVDTTARAAFDLGYELRVAADACAARPMTFNGVTVTAEMVNAAFMGAIGGVFAKCVSTEEITG